MQYVPANFELPKCCTPFVKGKYAGVLRQLWGRNLAQAGILVPSMHLMLVGIDAQILTPHRVQLLLKSQFGVIYHMGFGNTSGSSAEIRTVNVQLLKGSQYHWRARVWGKRIEPQIFVRPIAMSGEEYAKTRQRHHSTGQS